MQLNKLTIKFSDTHQFVLKCLLSSLLKCSMCVLPKVIFLWLSQHTANNKSQVLFVHKISNTQTFPTLKLILGCYSEVGIPLQRQDRAALIFLWQLKRSRADGEIVCTTLPSGLLSSMNSHFSTGYVNTSGSTPVTWFKGTLPAPFSVVHNSLLLLFSIM